MLSASALRIALVAALTLTGCASRSTSPRMSPVAPSAPVESSVAVAEPPAAAPAPLPLVGRLAVVQSTTPARLEFRDAKLGDLRAPRSALGERAKIGAAVGVAPGLGILGMSMGHPGGVVLGGAVALVGVTVGALTGTIVGGVQDAVDRSGIPSEKIDRYAPRLQDAGSDLVHGPLALRDCVAGQLAPGAQASVAAAAAPDFAALAEQRFSHALTLDAIEVAFVREPDGEARENRDERFAVTLVSHYRVHELADPPRVVHAGSARHGAAALRLDRWAAEQAREVHELAARGCPLLAEQISADLSARFSLARD